MGRWSRTSGVVQCTVRVTRMGGKIQEKQNPRLNKKKNGKQREVMIERKLARTIRKQSMHKGKESSTIRTPHDKQITSRK